MKKEISNSLKGIVRRVLVNHPEAVGNSMLLISYVWSVEWDDPHGKAIEFLTALSKGKVSKAEDIIDASVEILNESN